MRVCIKSSLMWNALIFRWFWAIGKGMPLAWHAWNPNSMTLLWAVCEWSKILIRKYSLFWWCYLCKKGYTILKQLIEYENDENRADSTVYLCSIRTYTRHNEWYQKDTNIKPKKRQKNNNINAIRGSYHNTNNHANEESKRPLLYNITWQH